MGCQKRQSSFSQMAWEDVSTPIVWCALFKLLLCFYIIVLGFLLKVCFKWRYQPGIEFRILYLLVALRCKRDQTIYLIAGEKCVPAISKGINAKWENEIWSVFEHCPPILFFVIPVSLPPKYYLGYNIGHHFKCFVLYQRLIHNASLKHLKKPGMLFL